MPDYRKMYLTLFDGVEKAIEALESRPGMQGELPKEILIDAQQQCEEIYIKTDI